MRSLLYRFIISGLSRPLHYGTVFFLTVWRALRTRFRIRFRGLYHWSYYPTSIHNHFLVFKNNSDFDIDSIEVWDFFKPNINNDKQIDFKINCAGRQMLVTELPNFWTSTADSNDDIEVLQSTHRFHWAVEMVVKGLSEADIKLVVETMCIWIKQFSVPDVSHMAWQPYTVSERLCNWITFIQSAQIFTNYPEYKQHFLLAIKNNVIYLTEKLEYPASGIINNHILNNARALYISGCFLDNKNITDLGRELFTRHLPDMVSKNGFLLESSFHYQLLLTRSIFEVQKVAKKYQDLKFSKWVCSFSTSMLKACQNTIPTNLHNLNDMPRIGDVSPDIPFTWFSPISYRLNADWNTLWNVTTNNIGNNHSINQDDGWVSFNKDNWSLVAFTHPDITQYPAGHGHNDFGSFCLYFSGYPIFIDIGRLNYVPLESGGSIGTKAESHNVLLIDSQEALFSGHGVSSIVSAESIKHTNFSIDNNGFSVWELICQNGEKWTRNIKIDSNKCITLSDRIDFCKEVKGFFNLHPGTNVEQINSKHIRLLFDNFQCDICFLNIQNLFIENIDFFPNYGEKIDSKRIVWYSLRNNKHIEHKIQILIEKVTLN